MNKQKLQTFLHFLKKHNCYHFFRINFHNYHDRSRTFEELIEERVGKSYSSVLAGSFEWEETPQGHHYWSRLSIAERETWRYNPL